MTVSIDTKVYLKGGRQYAHIKCSTSNHTVEKTVHCPRPVVNPITFGGNVNSESSQAQACAIKSRTGGQAGSRSKISKNMHIYRVFLSFNKEEIGNLISTLGVSKASFYITRMVGTRLKNVLNTVFNDTLGTAIQETLETIEEITEELEIIAEAASEREQIFNTIESTRVCLNQTNDFKILYDYSNNDYKMVLNDLTEFQEYQRYGLYGTSSDHQYTIKNIPFNHYIAVLNQKQNSTGQDISNFITYTGNSYAIPRYKVVNNNTYAFYTNEITITVKSNFMYNMAGENFIDGGISLYHYELGYMGMENAFIYTTDCAGVVGATIPEPNAACVDMSNIVVTNGLLNNTPVYLLNSEYKSFYYLNTGTYIFTDISALTPMNIIVNNSSSGLLFSGSDLSNASITGVDGNTYYYDQTVLTVDGEFLSSDLNLILYDATNDISYIQPPFYHSTTCTIELIGAIENVSIQLFMELANLENGIEQVTEDVSTYQLLIIKLNILIKILTIVNKLVDYTLKYYTQNGILDLTGTINEERTGSNVNLASKAVSIREKVQLQIDRIQDQIDLVEDDESYQNYLNDLETLAQVSKAEVLEIQNANKQFITTAASAVTDLNFQLDPFTDNETVEIIPDPSFSDGITRWFATGDSIDNGNYKGNILLLEFLSTGDYLNNNTKLYPTYFISSDPSLLYYDRDNNRVTSDIYLNLGTNITSNDNYIQIPSGGDIGKINCSTSGYYYKNMSYEMWVKSNTTTNLSYTIIEDLSRSLDISLSNTYQHIVKTFSISYDEPPISIETIYKDGVFDSSKSVIQLYTLSESTLEENFLTIGNTNIDISFIKFNIYKHELTSEDVSFLSLQDINSSSLNYEYFTFSNRNFYKFNSCVINNTTNQITIIPSNINYQDTTTTLLGKELWDESIGISFPFIGGQTTITGDLLDILKFEVVIIKSVDDDGESLQFIDFPNVYTSSQMMARKSDIVDFSNFKKYIPETGYIETIYLNNLNTEDVNRPVITLNSNMKYIKNMLTNWGIASDYVVSDTEDKYVAMYSIYI